MTLFDPRTLAEIGGAATVALLAFTRHMPAPKPDSVIYRWVFDSVQDLAKNNDRIGEVRPIPNQPAQLGQKEAK